MTRGVLYLFNDVDTLQAYVFEHRDAIPTCLLKELSEISDKFKMEKVIALDIGDSQVDRNGFSSFKYVLGDMTTVTVHFDKKIELYHR